MPRCRQKRMLAVFRRSVRSPVASTAVNFAPTSETAGAGWTSSVSRVPASRSPANTESAA